MRRIIKGLIGLAGFLLEILFYSLLLKNQVLFFLLSLPVHAGACILFAYSMEAFFPAGRGFGKITLFCTLFLSLYGFVGMLFILLLTKVRKQEAKVFHLDIEEDEGEEAPEDQALTTGKEAEILEVESFADILIGKDKELRLGAIDALQELKDQNAISILSASLDSTYHEVRYYAAEALNKIAQEYLDKITVLQQMVELKPEDTVIRQTLADLCFEYAFKGIEEVSIREYYYRLAAREYRYVLNINEDIWLLLNLMETEYRLKNYESCCTILYKILAQDDKNSRALERLADCLLKTGDYRKFREICTRLVKEEAFPVELRQAAEMWL